MEPQQNDQPPAPLAETHSTLHEQLKGSAHAEAHRSVLFALLMVGILLLVILAIGYFDDDNTPAVEPVEPRSSETGRLTVAECTARGGVVSEDGGVVLADISDTSLPMKCVEPMPVDEVPAAPHVGGAVEAPVEQQAATGSLPVAPWPPTVSNLSRPSVRSASVGDYVGDFQITSIWLADEPSFDGTWEHRVELSGTTIVEGTVFSGMGGVCMEVSDSSMHRIPNFIERALGGVFCFSNSSYAERMLGPFTRTGSALVPVRTVSIRDYTFLYSHKGTVDSTFLLGVAPIGEEAAFRSGASMQDTTVAVPINLRSCTTDADCTYVETTCSACCEFVGINTVHAAAFRQQQLEPQCESYKGPICDCVADTDVSCVRSVCTVGYGGVGMRY